MSKAIDGIVQNTINTKEFSGVILARLEFSTGGFHRYCNAYQTVYWEETAGFGEQAYIGLGNLAGISTLTETTDLSAQTIQLTLSGIPNSTITDIFSTNYIGKPVYLWYATIDKETYAVEHDGDDADSGPVLIFSGLMDFGTVEFGETATITVNATHRLADWERPRGGRFNREYQLRYIDEFDRGFKYVKELQNKPISWGGETVAAPGNDDGNGGGGGKHPKKKRCFEKGTQFYMQDGSLKNIEDINVEDIMLCGGEISTISIGNGKSETWYNYKGVIVTGGHSVLEHGIWKYVEDSLLAIPVEIRDRTYIVSNENNLMIASNNVIFSDIIDRSSELQSDISEKQIFEYLNSREKLNKELEQLKV